MHKTCFIVNRVHIRERESYVLLLMNYSGRGYGRGGDNRRTFGSSPKPVEMGKEYEVEISEISNKGDGIARIQGFVIFVVGGKVGQNVKIRITSIGERFAKAEVV